MRARDRKCEEPRRSLRSSFLWSSCGVLLLGAGAACSATEESDAPSLPADTGKPVEALPSSATIEAKTACGVPSAAALPNAVCDQAPASEDIRLPPATGVGVGLVRRVTSAALSGNVLYAGFEGTTCSREQGCSTSSGLYRLREDRTWQEVSTGEGKLEVAATARDVYSVRAAPKVAENQAIRFVRDDSAATAAAEDIHGAGFVTGVALAAGSFFSITADSDFRTSTLERRRVLGDGKLAAADLTLRLPGSAYWPRTNGRVLAWAENEAVSVADLDAKPLHRIALPHGAEYRSIEMEDGHVFAAYSMTEGNAAAVCSVDLQSAATKLVVSTPPDVHICQMAANSTHVFWTQSAQPKANCTQVWARRLDGGEPFVLWCGQDALGEMLVANDSAIYWYDGRVHHLDAGRVQ